MTAATPEALLATVEEAATALRMHEDTVRAMVASGELPHVQIRTRPGAQRYLIRVRWDDIRSIATPGEGS
jgi:excisionase family DNA binding protein